MQNDRMLNSTISVQRLEKRPHPKLEVSSGKIALMCDNAWRRVGFTYEGNKNMPPPNLPLWCKGCFELKAIEKQLTQKSSLPSPICLKVEHKFPFMNVFSLLSLTSGGGKTIIITRDIKSVLGWVYTNKFYQNNPYLLFISLYIYFLIIYCTKKPNAFSFLLLLFYKFIIFGSHFFFLMKITVYIKLKS